MPKVKYDISKGLHQVAGSGLELLNDIGTATAAGSGGTAMASYVALTKIVNLVSGGDGGGGTKKGVVLPDTGGADSNIGDVRVVVNLEASVLNVVGATATQKVEGANTRSGANGSASYQVAASSAAMFIYTGSTTGWIVVQGG